VDWPRRLEFDADYVDMLGHWYWPLVDLWIIAATAFQVVWQAVTGRDWVLLGIYGSLSILSNFLMQRTYETVEANVVQPFAYLQIVFVTMIGLTFFNEVLHLHVVVGVAIVVLAGLVALLLQRRDQVAA
jgi:drug/metabolite transporter (DMT)-like permease